MSRGESLSSFVPGGRLPQTLLAGAPLLVFETFALFPLWHPCGDPLLLLPSLLAQPTPETLQRQGSVPVLAAGIPRNDDESGGTVREADRGVRGVLVLAASTPGPEGVHTAFGEEVAIALRDPVARPLASGGGAHAEAGVPVSSKVEWCWGLSASIGNRRSCRSGGVGWAEGQGMPSRPSDKPSPEAWRGSTRGGEIALSSAHLRWSPFRSREEVDHFLRRDWSR